MRTAGAAETHQMRRKRWRTVVGRGVPGVFALALLCCAKAAHVPSLAAAPDEPSLVTLSIVGTSDLHGAASPRNGSLAGGLPLLAGYVNNLRAARRSDGGAVLLIDSGDTFQGDVESNLSEGALVVDAYNAMGYTAEAIGNHDFDFGSVDTPAARQSRGDLRGALKARAAQARYPFLAANLIDEATGRAVEWPNVRPSVLVDAAGIKVGIVGVMTIDALQSTIAANVQGLRIAPLAPGDRRRTRRSFEPPAPTSSSWRRMPADAASDSIDPRICRRASPSQRSSGSRTACPTGWSTSSPPATRTAGSRIRSTASASSSPSRAASRSAASTSSSIGGRDTSCGRSPSLRNRSCRRSTKARPVVSDPAVVQAMAPALARVHAASGHTARRLSRCANSLEPATLGSPLGNLFAEAIRAAVPGADVAAVNNAARGLWADLPEGAVTFGRLYDVFPFDNRIARITLTGAELGRVGGRRDPARPQRIAWHFRSRRANALSGGRPARRSVPRRGTGSR